VSWYGVVCLGELVWCGMSGDGVVVGLGELVRGGRLGETRQWVRT
jgi:hypothetical protein